MDEVRVELFAGLPATPPVSWPTDVDSKLLAANPDPVDDVTVDLWTWPRERPVPYLRRLPPGTAPDGPRLCPRRRRVMDHPRPHRRRRRGVAVVTRVLALAAYVATIVAANAMTDRLGLSRSGSG